jgi:hypothetical protein
LVAEARDPRGRADLLKQTNADLKILDAEYKKIDGKINAKRGDYENANTELKNKLDTIKRGDAASWVSTADTLGKTLDESQNGKLLNADALVADRKRLETEYRDPIEKRIRDAGYDPTEFLKDSDVYKLTSNSTSARDLSAAVQALGLTASDLTTSLTKLWDDPATGISKDDAAIAAAGRLNPVLKKTDINNNLSATYHEAGSLGNVVENAGGDSISTDPKWATVRADQKKFFDDVKNVYRPLPPGTKPTAPPPPVEAPPPPKYSDEDIQYVQTRLAEKNQLMNTLASNYFAQAGDLDGQDFPMVESAAHEYQFAKRTEDFLNEIKKDYENYADRTSNNATLQANLENRVELLNHMQEEHGWTKEDLEKYAPEQMAVGKLAYENLVNNSAKLADATKRYVNVLDGKAAQYIQEWDRTKHFEKSQDIADTLNMVINVATGIGIGGNAITQFFTKEFKEVGKTFDRFTNAYWLRAGQVGDMAQAFWEAGKTLKNFTASTTEGMQAEAQGNVDSANDHLNALVQRFNAYIDEVNKEPNDPNPFVIV